MIQGKKKFLENLARDIVDCDGLQVLVSNHEFCDFISSIKDFTWIKNTSPDDYEWFQQFPKMIEVEKLMNAISQYYMYSFEDKWKNFDLEILNIYKIYLDQISDEELDKLYQNENFRFKDYLSKFIDIEEKMDD